MAEERNVGLQRAPEAAGETDATKAELQRRMEEARESITQTVTEIKETVVNQYQQVRENISDTFDWREQYRRRPLPFTLGAFGVGICLGYSVAGAFKGDAEEHDELSYADEAETFDRIDSGFDRMSESPRPYVASPLLGGSTSSSAHRAAPSAAYSASEHGGSGASASADVGPDTRPSYSSGYQSPTAPQSESSYAALASTGGGQSAQAEEPKGPGLFERFKETKAYDRLQEELSTLGDRAVEELSRTARTVVVPALLGKLKDLIGIDLSTQQEVARRSRLEQQAAQTMASTAKTDEQQSTSGQGTTGAAGGNAAYATGGTSS